MPFLLNLVCLHYRPMHTCIIHTTLHTVMSQVWHKCLSSVQVFKLTSFAFLHLTLKSHFSVLNIYLIFTFFARLSQTAPLFKSTEMSPVHTQFLTTLLEELHFTKEDLESLTRIFLKDCLLQWSVNCKLFCMAEN